MQAPKLLSRRIVAEQLSISIRNLDRLIKKGIIQSVKLGGRVLIPASELDRVSTPAEV